MTYSHTYNTHEGFPAFPEIVQPVIDRARTIGSTILSGLTGIAEGFRDHAARSEDVVGPMTVLTEAEDQSINGDDKAKSGELYRDRDRSHDEDHEGDEPSGNGHKDK